MVNKILYIDVLIVLSCISVVLLHANGIFWLHPNGALWISSNIIESVFYFAVPVFFMISGLTLIDYNKRYSTKIYAQKRIKRTVIPFFFWSIIFYLGSRFFNSTPPHYQYGFFVGGIINTNVVSIYWFFIPLFSCYLIIPVLASIQNKIKIFSYIVIMLFISASVFPFLENLLNIKINPLLRFPMESAGGYIIYLLLGYLLGNIEIKKEKRICIYYFGVLGLFLHCYMTIILSPPGVPINCLFKGYLNFPCIFYSISIFVFCRYTDWNFLCKNHLISYLFNLIRDSSLGIYLLHVAFVYYICPYFINTTSIIYRTIGAVCIVLITAYIVYLLKKIPLLKRTI